MVKELVAQLEELKAQAEEHLEKAVKMGDLPVAWEVYCGLTELLPTLNFIPSREDYPLFREFFEDTYHWAERYMTYSFCDILDEALGCFYGENPEDSYNGYSKEQVEAIAWEVLRKGRSTFNYDW